MNNFIPEYVNLAKNSKVQELRPILNVGDYSIDIYGIIELNVRAYNPDGIDDEIRKAKTWLPTGDSLDDYFQNYCRENPIYHYDVILAGTAWEAYLLEIGFPKKKVKYVSVDENKNIAKIKLLISLLEGE